ncbi:MAG: MerR family transcriptional regulator [Microcella sp.]|uniref:MerR family transcriptional regulator n=1 Tax=Microcella sp. TaxID=1913979 RepID=UPI003314A8FF
MRMSELSSRTGVSIPTLKYYMREGLLPAGERTSPNQSRYNDTHVERVRLVRALLDVGGLDVARARTVVAAVDDESIPLGWVFGVAQRAVTIPASLVSDSADSDGSDDAGMTEGERLIGELCARRAWHVELRNPGLALAARVLDTYSSLGQDRLHAALDQYAEAADLVAAADLAAVASAPDEAEMTNVVVIGTVLGDALFAGLRRIAQEAESARRFPSPEGTRYPVNGAEFLSPHNPKES